MGGTCTCGQVQRSAFPEGVTATVQYGPGVLALAVYLTQSQTSALPAELFQELAGIALSSGTLQRAVTVATTHLEAPVAAIRGALLTAPVASCRREQKVSACFRSETGGEAFAVTRSSLSTLRKQSANLYSVTRPNIPGEPSNASSLG